MPQFPQHLAYRFMRSLTAGASQQKFQIAISKIIYVSHGKSHLKCPNCHQECLHGKLPLAKLEYIARKDLRALLVQSSLYLSCYPVL